MYTDLGSVLNHYVWPVYIKLWYVMAFLTCTEHAEHEWNTSWIQLWHIELSYQLCYPMSTCHQNHENGICMCQIWSSHQPSLSPRPSKTPTTIQNAIVPYHPAIHSWGDFSSYTISVLWGCHIPRLISLWASLWGALPQPHQHLDCTQWWMDQMDPNHITTAQHWWWQALQIAVCYPGNTTSNWWRCPEGFVTCHDTHTDGSNPEEDVCSNCARCKGWRW